MSNDDFVVGAVWFLWWVSALVAGFYLIFAMTYIDIINREDDGDNVLLNVINRCVDMCVADYLTPIPPIMVAGYLAALIVWG